MKGSKNDIKNRGTNTADPDRTLVIRYDALGHQHRSFQHVEGIRGRLSAVPSAPNGRRTATKKG